MTRNREISEIIFNKMKALGYEPYDISYGNGYFLFDYGEDSVVHFRVKGLWKHWKFGMWVLSELLDEPEDEEGDSSLIQLFAQYDTQIDKFKPSRSSLRINIKVSEWKENPHDCCQYIELERMLGMMKRHPFMCYCDFCGEYAGYADYSFLAEFIKLESREYISKAKKAVITAVCLPYTKFKLFFAKRAKCIKSIELYDFEKENPEWSTSYLYKVKPIFVADATDEQINKWFDRWFKKVNYGRFDIYHYVIEINEVRFDGSDEVYIRP